MILIITDLELSIFISIGIFEYDDSDFTGSLDSYSPKQNLFADVFNVGSEVFLGEKR